MLQMSRSVYDAMLIHVKSAYPLEACGLLAGQNGRIAHLYVIENILQSPVAFEMVPLQQVQAMLEIEAQGWALLAIYHSHPQGPEVPSPTDIARAYYREVGHLIISLRERAQPVVRAFTIRDGRVDELPLVIVQP